MKHYLRKSVPDDAVSLARIGEQTFALACPADTPASDLADYIQLELTPQRFLEHIATEDRFLFSGISDNEVIGYLMLTVTKAPPGVVAKNPIELDRIYISEGYHGTGLAQAFMMQAYKHAHIAGHDVLWLGVSRYNDRGIAFYRKSGFSVAGTKKFKVGTELHSELVMSCKVPDQPDVAIDRS